MTRSRTLSDGRVVEEIEDVRTYSIKTRCPDKWVLIDLETGQQYTPYKTEGKNDWEPVKAVEWKRIDF